MKVAILDNYHDTVHALACFRQAGAFIHQPMPQRMPPVNRKTGGPNRSTDFQNLLQKRN